MVVYTIDSVQAVYDEYQEFVRSARTRVAARVREEMAAETALELEKLRGVMKAAREQGMTLTDLRAATRKYTNTAAFKELAGEDFNSLYSGRNLKKVDKIQNSNLMDKLLNPNSLDKILNSKVPGKIEYRVLVDEFTAAEWGMDLGDNSIDEIEYVIREGRKGGLAIGFTLEDARNPEALSRVIGALNKELLQQIRAEVEEAIS